MSGAEAAGPGTRVDANLVIGPWVHDDQPGWTAKDAELHLDLIGAAHGLVRHSTAVEYDAAAGNRRLVEEIASHPRLLPAFVLGPLESGEHGQAASLPDHLADCGVRALWIYPRRHGWSLVAPEAASLLDLLEGLGLPVWIDLAETEWSEVAAAARRHPGLRLVVAGIGYRMLRPALATLTQCPQVSLDTSYLASGGGLELIVQRFGASRVVAGSGAPVRDAYAPWYLSDRSTLTPADRSLVEGGNAFGGLSPTELDVRAPAVSETHEVIDAHAHLGHWPSTWIPGPGVDDLIWLMERSGTSHTVFSHLEALFADTRSGNALALTEAARRPDLLSVHLVVNPHHPQDRHDLAIQAGSSLVAGIKVHPDLHECPIDDARYRWVWEFALEQGLTVLSHGFSGTRFSDPLLFGPVAATHPDLTLLVGHSGATPEGFRRTIQVCRDHPNLLAETCGSWMTGWWLRRLVDALGPERVIHGTDSSLIDPRYGVGRVLGADLSAPDRALVLAGNATRVLRLRPASTPTGGS